MRWRVLLVFTFFLTIARADAFDISGLQPLAPHGIFSTFSADSLPAGRFSFEVWTERSREPDFYRFALKCAYGLSDNLEIMTTVPYVYDFQDQTDGLEDIAIGLKHRFYDEGKYGPSLAYLLQASIPSAKTDLGTDGRFGVGLILSKRIGPFQGHFNVAYAKPGTGDLEDEILFSSGIEFSAAHHSKLLGEFVARKGHVSDEYNQLEARVGYRVRTTDAIFTTIGGGMDFKNRSPEYRVFLSVNFTTPFEKKRLQRIIEEE